MAFIYQSHGRLLNRTPSALDDDDDDDDDDDIYMLIYHET